MIFIIFNIYFPNALEGKWEKRRIYFSKVKLFRNIFVKFGVKKEALFHSFVQLRSLSGAWATETSSDRDGLTLGH